MSCEVKEGWVNPKGLALIGEARGLCPVVPTGNFRLSVCPVVLQGKCELPALISNYLIALPF